jgi:hypothetical protein
MYLLPRLRLVLAAYLNRGTVTGRASRFRAGSGYVYPLTTRAGNNCQSAVLLRAGRGIDLRLRLPFRLN